MKKIYVVKSSEGEYEDYFVWNEKAFTKKEDAEAYAKELDEMHCERPAFITDEFISLLRECEEKLPDWEEFPDYPVTSENRENWGKWMDEQEKKQNNMLFQLMYERGQLLTQTMYDLYLDWESNSYRVWHDCIIEELDLV